ncbi:MAG: PAS domain-containing protein [Janthinobacterium lividum]
MRGRPFFEALPELRGQGYEAAYATLWQTEQVVTWREACITLVREAGGPAVPGYFDVTFQPFYEGSGCLAGILVTSHDVTEQVLARQHLHHATAELAATNAGLADYVRELTQAAYTAQAHAEGRAALLALLLEQVPLAIGLLVGADYVVETCSPSLLARWGRTGAQVQHQPLFEVLPELQGQDLRELLDEVGRTGAPVVAQQPGPGGAGAAPMSFTYYPLRDAQGHVVAIAAMQLTRLKT